MNEQVDLYPGFEGVAAFSTAICTPSSTGKVLRYRGVDIQELVGLRPYDEVWRLLVDGEPGTGELSDIGASEVLDVLDEGGQPRVALQRALLAIGEQRSMSATTGVTDQHRFRQDIACLTSAFGVGLGILAGRRHGGTDAVLKLEGTGSATLPERLVEAWLGFPEPRSVRVIDTVMSAIAEHGTTASTFAARVVASTGANAAACLVAGLSAIGGPRHGGATHAVVLLLRSLASAERSPDTVVAEMLAQGQRLPGLGHRVYREGDPRVAILRRLADEIEAPLAPLASAYQAAAEKALRDKGRDRGLPANVDLWLPVVLDAIGMPDDFMDAVLAAGRMAGWSAHSLEQVESGGKILRPSDIYAGVDARTLA